ncbi:MAG: CoA transferase [Dehalococcoidia bacterium]|nr:CoA transferase [Dehalococcoidia bacterium]
MTGPLVGIRIITFTQAWAGTSATELLAFLGADVIQIESRTHPDIWRGGYAGEVPPGVRDESRRQRKWNTAAAYNSVNLNKRAITLDVADERGRALFRRLVPLADVIADNFTPAVMRKWGLDYDSLRAIRPDIIAASLSAYGATGPLRDVRGIGGTLEPMSGLTSLLGYEGGRPMNSGSMIPDPIAGAWFAAAIVTAIRHRSRTGEGQYIDLGMMEATAMMAGDAVLEFTANGRVRARTGNRHPRIAPHGTYEARDGRWLALCADDEEQWRALARLIGDPTLLDAARFATQESRKLHEVDLDARIALWAGTQDAEAAEVLLLAAGVPAARVRSREELLKHPALLARGFAVEVDHPEAGRRTVAGAPWVMSRTQPEVTRPAPMLGEHSLEVFQELLDMDRGEYEELVALGISGDGPPDGQD